jgi:hypothetical protein
MMTENLSIAVNEKDVENVYRHNLIKKFKDMEITSPFGCDGFGVSKTTKIRTLMEFKDDLNLSSKTELAKVLCQSIFYIKRFYDKGIVPPSTIFIADRNECTVLHVNDVIKYLEMDLNWSTPPSQAHTITELLLAIIKDENVNPFVYGSDNFGDCVEKIKDLTDNIQRKVLVTDKNITEVFRYFDNKVLGKNNKLTTNEKANLFVQILVNKDDNYLHPVKKRKTVVTKSFGEVSIVSRDAFESFFGHFSSSYTPSQKHKLAAVVDRIIEDTTRRKQGEFFTPAIWVDKAHEYIASVYGEDWKEKYIVWDPAWGTGNLTRDYKFKELYVSTLNQSDIDTANQMGYNPEAVKFQYDFLNDDYEQLPTSLRNAIEVGKEIIVLMNPPYAASGTMNHEKVKIGLTNTMVAMEMKKNNLGKVSNELYTQFIFKCITLKFHICLFSKPMFLTSPSFKNLRKELQKNYQFDRGFMIDASNFADVKSWGLSFSIINKSKSLNDLSEFSFDLLSLVNSEIVDLGSKKLYNTDKMNPASSWVRTKIKGLKTIDMPQIKSALEVKQTGYGRNIVNSLGYLYNDSNNVYKNSQGVCVTTSVFSHGHGVPIIKENLLEISSLYAARKLVTMNWINEYDEYLEPDTKSSNYLQFQYDSLVILLFNNSSQQSSLRQVLYKGDLWDIKNEFFWMSNERIKKLADQFGYDELYNDARISSERHIYDLLFGEKNIYEILSHDAKQVLDMATQLTESSIEIRNVVSNHENHLNSWDAGYAQQKIIWKEYFQPDFKKFREDYKKLENRMRPLVYDLKFLKN